MTVQEPDLVLEGTHLGRGTCYYDKEANKLFLIIYIYIIIFIINEIIFNFLDIA